MPQRLARLILPGQRSGEQGRLAEFGAPRLGPIAAFFLVAALLYWWQGFGVALEVFVKLWAAYAVAFLVLASLAAIKGPDPHWVFIVPAVLIGVALSGFAAAAIALAPEWSALGNPARAGQEWAAGAAFSAFFIGLSFATGAVRRREQRASDVRRQLVEARLQTLTAQIEPHFLMNTLANLRYLIKTDSASAHHMIDHLADFLEGALERSRNVRSTLGEELQLVVSYLSIMQIRFGDRLRFALEVPDELKTVALPPLLLQALVENAVTHGIEPCERNCVIRVSAYKTGFSVILRVADSGVGFDPAKSPVHGVGLDNTRQRLATFYRGRASLSVAPAEPSGTVATVSLPLGG